MDLPAARCGSRQAGRREAEKQAEPKTHSVATFMPTSRGMDPRQRKPNDGVIISAIHDPAAPGLRVSSHLAARDLDGTKVEIP